ncbi:hypothetical protein HSBAA_19220 [Vreelandella sulfidaeris]|uniref:Uncharacterized protein n=1 Tax=Vreelandella sulfidaeris TaxID=115553 RepID=A0A455U3M4_9GAMM|nr:hypothetical protein HSBAA_19220 [Halomonas sulfidaeris]
MTLIKTSLLNGIAVVIKMLTLLGLNKILAIYVGPTGYAAIGNFQNAVQMITTFASGAINTGVVKYTAEYYNEEENNAKFGVQLALLPLSALSLRALVCRYLVSKLHICFKDESYNTVLFGFP